jgi:hypothetical protein
MAAAWEINAADNRTEAGSKSPRMVLKPIQVPSRGAVASHAGRQTRPPRNHDVVQNLVNRLALAGSGFSDPPRNAAFGSTMPAHQLGRPAAPKDDIALISKTVFQPAPESQNTSPNFRAVAERK